jgi:hypothetical protein
MEEENLLTPQDLQLLSPATPSLTPASTDSGFDAWLGERGTNVGDAGSMDTTQPAQRSSAGPRPIRGQSNNANIKTDSIAESMARANGSAEDTTKFTINTNQLSNRYPLTYKGIDNETAYAGGQTLGQKAVNGVVKMAGIATTTFVNGTAGLVYGIAKAAEDGKVESFYNNDLTNYLNNVTAEMEDSFAHYKTERERTGDWWEPANVFSGNFYLIILLKT